MRNLSIQTLDDMFAESTGSTPIELLRFTATSNSGTPIVYHYCNNATPITSNGVLYQPAVFSVSLGRDASDQVPSVNLSFDIGDRQIVTALRELNSTPKVYASVVIAERPNVVEIPEIEYTLDSWSISETIITMNLTVEPVLNEPIPADRVTPLTAPAVWQNVLFS